MSDLAYPTLDDFVSGFVEPILVRSCARSSLEVRWCPEWQRHPAAAIHLEALWTSYESARLDPRNGISRWLRDQADYHVGAIRNLRMFGPCDGTHVDRGDDRADEADAWRLAFPGSLELAIRESRYDWETATITTLRENLDARRWRDEWVTLFDDGASEVFGATAT